MVFLCLLVYTCSAQSSTSSSSSNNPNKHRYLIEKGDEPELATIFGKKVTGTLCTNTLNIITDYVINCNNITEHLPKKSHLTKNGLLEQWQLAQTIKAPKVSKDFRSILVVALSQDGSQIAAGYANGDIGLWNKKNDPITLRGHSDNVIAVAFSPNGRQLASGSADKTIRVWETKNGQNLHILDGHSDDVTSVSFSPDSSQIASVSNDQTLKIWDMKSGKNTRVLRHPFMIRSVAFSPDSSQIAAGSYHATIRIWNMKGEITQMLLDDARSVDSLAFSPDGSQIATGSKTGVIKFWNIKTGQKTYNLELNSGRLYEVAFSPHGPQIISLSQGGTFRRWHLHQAKVPVSTLVAWSLLTAKQDNLAIKKQNKERLTQATTALMANSLPRKKSCCSIQ